MPELIIYQQNLFKLAGRPCFTVRTWRMGEWPTPWTLADYYILSKEQSTALIELKNYQPHQSFGQNHL